MKKYFLTIYLFCCVIALFAQAETENTAVVDTSHIVLPDSILRDTAFARRLYDQALKLISDKKPDDILAYNKADTAFAIYKFTLGYETEEVVRCQHIKASVFIRWGDYKKAEAIYSELLNIQTKILGEYHFNVTRTLTNLAFCSRRNGAYDKAIDYLRKVLVIRQELFGESDSSLVDPFYGLGECYLYNAEYEKALKYLQKASEIQLKIKGENDLKLSSIYDIFSSCYFKLNDYDMSLEFSKRSLQIQLNVFGELNKRAAYSYNNMGNCYVRKGFYLKSIQYHEKALAIKEKFLKPGHPDIAISYNNIGNVYRNMGKYDKALEYYQNALSLSYVMLDSVHPDIAFYFNNIATCYTIKGDFGRAESCFQKSLEIRKKIFSRNHPEVASTYNDIGTFLRNKTLYDEAINYYKIANEIYLSLPTPDSIGSANTFYNIGLCNFRKGDYAEALENHKKGLHVYLNVNNQSQKLSSASYEAIGDTYFKMKILDKAKENYLKSLNINLELLGISLPLTIRVMKNLISNYEQLNMLDSAQVFTEKALSAIVEQIASNVATETKSLYLSQNLPIYEAAIDLAIARSGKNADRCLLINSYPYSEMAKATLLQNQIRQNDALTFSGIPDSLIDRENEIRLNINYREKQRREIIQSGKAESDSTVLRISSIIFDLKREQEELIAHFEKEYPDYYGLRYDLSTISLEETQQNLLQANQSLLEYFVGDSSIYVLVVTKDTFAIQGIKRDFPLDSLVQQLQSGIYGYYGKAIDDQTDELYRTTVNLYSDAATALYDKLVRPISSLLTKDVIIVPDGVLGYVPFEILLKNEPAKIGQFQNYPYLFQDHNVSYSYSATLLKEMKEKKHKKNPERSILALAPFYTGSYELLDSTINLVFDTLSDGRDTAIFGKLVTRKSFSQLQSSGEEVTTAAKIWGGDYCINQDASRQNFLEKADDYRILHLATHGTADVKEGKYSYLVFADTKDSIENEFLYVRDLYNMSLNADLVVLSACETAVGELQRGEGIVSLARGFAYAGAKSILTTLWMVDDTATKDLLRDFYINLRKGQDKNVALSNARIKHLKKAKSRYRHPFFWAGFIGIGDMSKIGE